MGSESHDSGVSEAEYEYVYVHTVQRYYTSLQRESHLIQSVINSLLGQAAPRVKGHDVDWLADCLHVFTRGRRNY